MKNDIEHLNDLMDEIDILIYLLRESKEEDPIKSKLIRKEYKELPVYNSNAICERCQKDLFLVGEDRYQTMSDKIHYVNHRGVMCESGGKMGCKWGIGARGVKVLWESHEKGKDLPIDLKKSKIIKIWIDEASRDGK